MIICTRILQYGLKFAIITVEIKTGDKIMAEVGFTIQNNVLKKYKGNAVNLEIPEGVETIGQDAFWGCKQIKRVKLPSTVKVIAQEAFRHCEQLEEINIPDGVRQ